MISRARIIVAIDLLLILLCMFLALAFLSGCGSERDTQTKTIEKVESFTGPLVLDTPIGQFVAQPVKHTMLRSEDTVEREEKRITMPDAGAFMSAAPALAGPLGIAGTLLGGVTTVAAWWMAMRRGKQAENESAERERVQRQRDEIIDGVERAKDSLGEKWADLTAALEKEQSRDTKEAVKARVG